MVEQEKEGAMDAANILKPALARGELRAVGSTLWANTRNILKRQGAGTAFSDSDG